MLQRPDVAGGDGRAVGAVLREGVAGHARNSSDQVSLAIRLYSSSDCLDALDVTHT